jgi:D-galactarolactone isomerase
MYDEVILAAPPRSADDTYCLTAADWTDCDFVASAPDANGSALAALGIARTVQNRLPPKPPTLSPTMGRVSVAPATRFVIDTPAPGDLATLHRLHDQGVRGIRHRLAADAATLTVQFDAIRRDADAIAPLDWHIELTPPADLGVLERNEAILTQLPVALCLSAIAPALVRLHRDDEAYVFVLDLLHMGRTWLKLDAAAGGARGFVNTALAVRRDRLVWGSGAPAGADRHGHVAASLAALVSLVPDEDDRAAVLIANPARLYGFPG